VSSDEQAKEAYEGLNGSIGKSIILGFQGFNMASSTNISPPLAADDELCASHDRPGPARRADGRRLRITQA